MAFRRFSIRVYVRSELRTVAARNTNTGCQLEPSTSETLASRRESTTLFPGRVYFCIHVYVRRCLVGDFRRFLRCHCARARVLRGRHRRSNVGRDVLAFPRGPACSQGSPMMWPYCEYRMADTCWRGEGQDDSFGLIRGTVAIPRLCLRCLLCRHCFDMSLSRSFCFRQPSLKVACEI